MTQIQPVIFTDLSERKSEAKQLAEFLHTDCISNQHDVADYPFVLVLTANHIELHCPPELKFKPFFIDFNTSKLNYRSHQASLRKEMLARAIGFHPKDNPFIVDATAGLGRDSFILASLGFKVTMLEKSSIIYVLLEDALKRAKKLSISAAERMQLLSADAVSWLPAQLEKPDVIYLDPMFPERRKSASVKKEMALLQALLPEQEDPKRLFETAVACAKHRVVVKRPRLAETITERQPNYSLKGTSSRFDIYLS